MVQGGYVSQSNNKVLTVSKKGNALNKISLRGSKGSTNSADNSNSANNNNLQQSSSVCGGIDVSINNNNYYFIINTNNKIYFYKKKNKESELKDFMDDIKKQCEEMKKQSDEMRKLKAIIVKHENRIRSLEASLKAREDDVLDSILLAEKQIPATKKIDLEQSPTPMAPDEV